MTHIIVERDFPDGLTPGNVINMAEDNTLCFSARKVAWHGSFLATNGKQMICWFECPDAESARIALKESGAVIWNLWPATVHEVPDHNSLTANVLVIRAFEEAVKLDDIQALEDANAFCLETRNVKFVRTFFSFDKKRMLCLYQGPDAESVREAQRQAKMPFENIWAYERVAMPNVSV